MLARIRLPLQVGTSSLWSLLRALLSLVPGVVLIAVGAATWGGAEGSLAGIDVGLGGFLVVYAFVNLRRAWRARPSDVLLDGQGLRFEGGAQHGLALAWDQVDATGTVVETPKGPRLSLRRLFAHAFFLGGSMIFSDTLELAPDEPSPVRRLRLKAKDGRSWGLAEAELPAEQASLDALTGTLRAKAGGPLAPAPSRAQQVFTCSSCGGALVPAATPQVTCRFCGGVTAMPADARARIEARSAVDVASGEVERLLPQLLDQPGARRATATLVVAGLFAAPGWIATVLAVRWMGPAQAGGFELGWAFLAGGLLSTVAAVFARAGLANRRALRVLASSFGARPPAEAGGALGCRRCRAPLPEANGLLARCAFCEAENVLGLDLRGLVAPTRDQSLSLSQVLHARRRERKASFTLGLVALVVGLLATVMLLVSVEMAQAFAAEKQRCEGGDAEACLSVAVDLDLGISVAKDAGLAATYEKKACELGSGDACYRLGERYRWGWGVDENLSRARQHLGRGCELGFDKACHPDD